MILKSTHLFTDPKFIFPFEDERFKDTLIFIGHFSEERKKAYKHVLFFDSLLDNFTSILDYVNSSDILVLHGLSNDAFKIVQKCDSRPYILWRFYGFEFYARYPTLSYSAQSLKYIENRANYRKIIQPLFFLKNALKPFYVKYLLNSYKRVIRKRIDGFWGLADTEYFFIKKYWPDLPPFYQHGYKDKYSVSRNTTIAKRKQIIIGNSRWAYNNHLDVLDVIDGCISHQEYSFKCFFSYGLDNVYADQVRKRAKDINNFELIEDFLTTDYFQDIYAQSAALVINSYRQLAMGNIFQALACDTKIYMNSKNPIYHWFLKEGIKVFEVSRLKHDLDAGSIFLTKNETAVNREAVKQLIIKYNQVQFYDKLYSTVRAYLDE